MVNETEAPMSEARLKALEWYCRPERKLIWNEQPFAERMRELVVEVWRLRAVNAELEVIAAEAWASAEPQVSYGPFPGGDPRRFKPDEECCSVEEIANWKAACDAWDGGEYQDRGPGCLTLGDGSVAAAGTGFGIGTYTWSARTEANT